MTDQGGERSSPAVSARREYLDWLRGLAVLIMVGAHTADAWTAVAERSRPAFRAVLLVGGIGGPIFLFLAGMALSLAAGARVRRGEGASAAARRTAMRGLQVFGLAFLLQFQSWVLSGGSFARKLLRVEILHVMGVSMLAAAILWRLGRGSWSRTSMLAAAAALVAFATPIVRASPITAALPDVIEWYVIPVPGRSTFTLFPWSGFLIAGAAVGVVLDRAQGIAAERRMIGRMAAGGAVLAAAAYAGSYLPSVFAASSFWTTSPAFFFVRLGILVLLVPMAYVWMSVGRTASPVRELGWSSLFVYWIHLELVYGSPSRPLHRALTVEQAAVAFGLFTLVLYVMVRLKHRFWDGAGAAGAAVRNMAQRQPSPGHTAS